MTPRPTSRTMTIDGRPYAVKRKRGYGHPPPGAGASVAST
jgi:hypothetical protein